MAKYECRNCGRTTSGEFLCRECNLKLGTREKVFGVRRGEVERLVKGTARMERT